MNDQVKKHELELLLDQSRDMVEEAKSLNEHTSDLILQTRMLGECISFLTDSLDETHHELPISDTAETTKPPRT